MIERIKKQFLEAATQRRGSELPKVGWIIAVTVVGTTAYILLAIMFVPSGESREFHFLNERGVITVLSAILFAAAGTFSMAALVARIRMESRFVETWAILSVSFFFFAFDELLEFHERAGIVLERYADPGMFRNWNDVIVIGYGILAAALIGLSLPTLVQHRILLAMFVTAFAFYAIHTLIDSAIEPKTTMSVILEESAKLFSAAFLAIGSFVGFLGAFWNSTQAHKL